MSFGYDTTCTTLSQEGRIYQLEYAEKGIENSSTVLGIVFKDGVLLLSEKIRQSKSVVSGSNPTVYSVAPNIGIAICGLIPDGRNLVERAKLEASSYLKTYGIDITGKILTERLAVYVHMHTCHWSARPFGCCVFITSYELDGSFHLYMLETSGNFYEYYSSSHGKGRQFVKAEIEKDNFAIRNKTINEGLFDTLKVLMRSFEGEKETEYDAGIISKETKGMHKILDKTFMKQMITKAKQQIEEDRKMVVD